MEGTVREEHTMSLRTSRRAVAGVCFLVWVCVGEDLYNGVFYGTPICLFLVQVNRTFNLLYETFSFY